MPSFFVSPVQVCLSLKNQKTRDRELSALIKANQALKAQQLYLITLDEAETLSIEGQEIICLPL